MWTHGLGMVNAALVIFSVMGIFLQLRTVWLRRATGEVQATHLLSNNQFLVSFLAYCSFFIYGMATVPFNHFLVWPRLMAALLMWLILIEIWRDRRSALALGCAAGAGALLLAGIAFGLFGSNYQDEGKTLMTALLVVVTVILAQGYAHQILTVIRAGDTGALDKRMSLYILIMDVSTLAFAASLGMAQGWPLMLLATVSGITKVIILYLFWWVRAGKLTV
ncbi:hypothetical protein LJ739_10210 [Aestuariibacter halophilus]|uniref:Uncharacterized protein n=1 Tax=Fluctibacter halophilus TaxID=226011 RepID=A0ABS8G7U2_9ALTE|nr:hypothetical protein [Aestuariibacter halophilus]MCC2616615.1 hypothetical protein [Aestuariibacter halophilus]